jgi:kinesin family protein 2/24
MEVVKPRIQVVVRKRPLSAKETLAGETDILQVRSPSNLVVVEQRIRLDLAKYEENHDFVFDGVFGEATPNHVLFQECLQPLVKAAFEGSKVTVFAYGQTGSGKTYTMMGEDSVPGLYLSAASDLFKIKGRLSVVISFFEIYCGKLYDLLNERESVVAREDAKQQVNIIGLTRQEVESVDQLMALINNGMALRKTGHTGANEDSSRSHAVLEITLKDAKHERGKMTFIDLAGCERGADVRDTDRQTRIDGAEINKSLLALKECIRAMDQEKTHTPFRGSKLTQVLKDSFVGNCRTLMIANVSPALSCCEYTLNTLRYADRVKELRSDRKDDSNPMMLPRAVKATPRNQSETVPSRPKLKQPTPTKVLQPASLNAQASKIGRPAYQPMNYRQAQPNKDFLKVHRRYLDEAAKLIKKDTGLLTAAEKPTSDISAYVQSLRASIVAEERLLQDLKGRLEEYAGSLE